MIVTTAQIALAEIVTAMVCPIASIATATATAFPIGRIDALTIRGAIDHGTVTAAPSPRVSGGFDRGADALRVGWLVTAAAPH
jgi:hypothetical protein